MTPADELIQREKKVLAVSSSAHFLTHFYILIFPAIVMPLAREMELSISDIFPLGFMMYMLYGALALPAGYLADHWSKMAVLKICVLGMSLSSLAAGFSSGITGFAVSLAMIGFFCGLYHPAGLGLISSEIRKQGSAQGINGIFGNIGIAAAPFSAGVVLLVLNWRWVYALAGFLGLIVLAFFFIVNITETDQRKADSSKASNNNRKGYLKYFAVLCVGIPVAGLIYRANLTALPSYLELRAPQLLDNIVAFTATGDVNALSGAAALVVSSLFLFSMVGQYVGGKMADKIDLRRAYFFFHLFSVPFIFGMAVSFETPLYFFAAGMVFFNLGMIPIENSLLSKFIPKRWISTGYGIKFTLTFGIGSFAVYEVAYLEKSGGLEWVYFALIGQAIILVSVAGFLMFYSRSIKNITNAPTEEQVT